MAKLFLWSESALEKLEVDHTLEIRCANLGSAKDISVTPAFEMVMDSFLSPLRGVLLHVFTYNADWELAFAAAIVCSTS